MTSYKIAVSVNMLYTYDGTRTRNPWLRRPVPYLAMEADTPFGHEGRHLCNTFNDISEILTHLKIRLAWQFILFFKLKYGVTPVELML